MNGNENSPPLSRADDSLPSAVLAVLRRRPLFWLAFGCGLILLKLYFREQTAADLGWILAPSATFAGFLADTAFVFTDAGYRSLEGRFLIDRSCAGLNFFVLALALGGLVAFPAEAVRTFPRLIGVVALGYAATIFANGIRIAGAIRMDAPESLLSPAALHTGALLPGLAGANTMHLAHGALSYLVVYVLYYELLRRIFRGGGSL